jgi:hypothetical protein
VRLALAIIVSAIAQLLVYLRFAGAVEGTPVLVLPYIVLATLGAGWFAARRSALAGALSVVLAATLYAAAIYLGPAGLGMAAGDIAGSVIAIVATFWPYVAIGAIAGALGGALRGRVLSRSARG